MKAIIADTHYHNHSTHGGELVDGLNDRARAALECYRKVLALQGVTDVIIAGDVFDTWAPPPPVRAAVVGVAHASVVTTHAMVGNHDFNSSVPHDHSMAGLEWTANFRPVAKPTLLDNVLMVPFGYDPLAIEPPPQTEYVVAHHGLWGPGTPEFLRKSKHAKSADEVKAWCDEHGVLGYFAGDWHRHERFHNGTVVQIGALCPASFRDEGGHGYGTVILLGHKDGIKFLEIPGPRFIKADYASDLAWALPKGCTGYARVKHGGPLSIVGYAVIDVVNEEVDVGEAARVAIESTGSDAVERAYHDWVMADQGTPPALKEDVVTRGLAYLAKARGAM